ncbi:MAG: hypothetical protein HYV39_01315 [Candidatus Levybacteria bacterium]|nr:hypothetical protein [Candidatus Levybacteria bacterium]
MNASFKQLATDKIALLSFLATIALILLHVLLLLFSFSKLPPFLPLFNQLPWGEARISDKTQLFIPLALATAVFLSNLIASYFIYMRMPLVARFLLATTLLVAFFAFAIAMRTVLIVL